MKKILIINLGGIGDFLLSTPALKALRAGHPQAQFDILATRRICELARLYQMFDHTFEWKMEYGGLVPLRTWRKNYELLLGLRQRHFDLAVNMRTLVTPAGSFKMRCLLGIIAPAQTAGRNTDGRGRFFDVRIPETTRGLKHEMLYDIETVEALGCSVEDRKIVWPFSGNEEEEVRNLLGREDLPKDRVLVGVHPGGMPSRRWPAQHFMQLLNGIADQVPCHFVFTGSHLEKDLGEMIRRNVTAKCVNFCGALSLAQTAALIKQCRLFISNDTGPMHIAAVVGTPLLAIMGPGDLRRFDPRQITQKVVVVYRGAECAPCEKVHCRDLRCLKAVTPSEVIQAALVLLGKPLPL